MKKLVTITIICLVAVSLSSCRAGPPWMQWMFKGPKDMNEKNYPPLYIEGWQHGCESGASATVRQWYKQFYRFKQDAYKAQDKTYYKGWKDAFEYCQRYLYQYKKRGTF